MNRRGNRLSSPDRRALLAGAGAGAGWWFGSGPGGMVAVPYVVGKSFADAKALLAEHELTAREDGEHSLTVDEGLTIRTDPGAGTPQDKGATVTVVTSLGPADVTLPKLQNQTVEAVEQLLADAEITVGEKNPFFTSFQADRVVRVYVTEEGSEDAVACADGCTVKQGSIAEIRYSLGEVPDVVGETFDDAKDILAEVDLKAKSTEEFSSSVERGRVIRVLDREGSPSWRPGETLTLVVSKGPELFEVPNVVGRTLSDAAQTLRDAGFEPSYQAFWNAVPDGLTRVESTSPAGGQFHPKGTSIDLTISLLG